MTINATEISQGNYKCYLGVMNAKKVFDNSIVSRASEDQTDGFQRNLDSKRAQDIADYLDSGNVIPGCIILSTQEDAKLSFDMAIQKITFKELQQSFFVIDGQHRLFGSHLAKTDIDLPVYIFTNLNVQEEIQLFLDVNSKQKGVPKTLRIALTKFLIEPDSIDHIRLELFHRLNTDQESPLFNKLTSASSVSGKLSHVPFQQAIDPILNSSSMKALDLDQKYMLLNNLLTALSDILIETLTDSKKLTSTVLFTSIFKNFDLICNLALMSGGYKYEIFKRVLQPIQNVDFESLSGAGSSVNKVMTENIKELLESQNQLSDMSSLF
jgi:DNA sulfur modification protein DndB